MRHFSFLLKSSISPQGFPHVSEVSTPLSCMTTCIPFAKPNTQWIVHLLNHTLPHSVPHDSLLTTRVHIHFARIQSIVSHRRMAAAVVKYLDVVPPIRFWVFNLSHFRSSLDLAHELVMVLLTFLIFSIFQNSPTSIFTSGGICQLCLFIFLEPGSHGAHRWSQKPWFHPPFLSASSFSFPSVSTAVFGPH